MTGEELRQARRRLGLSQQALADALGLSRRMIIAMEQGDKSIERRTELAVRYLTEISCRRPLHDL